MAKGGLESKLGMGKGWRHEPIRHGLSAQGMKTGRASSVSKSLAHQLALTQKKKSKMKKKGGRLYSPVELGFLVKREKRLKQKMKMEQERELRLHEQRKIQKEKELLKVKMLKERQIKIKQVETEKIKKEQQRIAEKKEKEVAMLDAEKKKIKMVRRAKVKKFFKIPRVTKERLPEHMAVTLAKHLPSAEDR